MSKNFDTTWVMTAIPILAAAIHTVASYAEQQRFNALAAGLTTKERAVAQKFWNAAKRDSKEERQKHAVTLAALERVEAARVALDRLDQATALLVDPTCHPQVARWLTKHWLIETGEALRGRASSTTKKLVREELEPELEKALHELRQQLEKEGVLR